MGFSGKFVEIAGASMRWWGGAARAARAPRIATSAVGSTPVLSTSLASVKPLPAVAAPELDLGQVLRGASFGNRWIEVHATRQYKRALDKVVAERGRTGPKSMRVDDAILHVVGAEVQVAIGNTVVGVLGETDTLTYRAVLESARRPVESSGIVVIDAEGHPGARFKLYLPEPDMLVPVNALNPAVAVFPAWDRAGGLTLAKRKTEHALIDAVTDLWWAGVPRSAWVVLNRSGIVITATMDGLSLPTLDPARSAPLRATWLARHPETTQMHFEAQVYEIKAGRQVNIRYPLS